jgi:hypothetical protein
MSTKLSINNNNNFNNSINLPYGVKRFCITKTDLTEEYKDWGQRIPTRIVVGVEWEFEATVTYELWLKLKPYTESRTVCLTSCNIETKYGELEVTFTLKGFGQQAPTSLMLSEAYIPLDKQSVNKALPGAI